ncbi:PAS domain S-box protein [Streptomyces alfalfae]|uniref:Histidine kinase n=1 Tax=Streptomyces alfalfae TaxID=1642299 RepID=A0ABM6H1K4_9ACTN|nr:PAS domain S-box protein [Streptomyces alfalfae]AYA20413.1 PAS domain S-box protein [Streptomyces fradiae]APY89952.1 histidine kinase [Streptomyces alfalfae]QUI29975.1 PAS domain S-box protein [Streptomyces alfalfae]RXX42776.1 PAS domain S-box protein [Streptomyces alfalfae]RZM86397.1 PAS domain S-box protein [Streptomyces alfalfae]
MDDSRLRAPREHLPVYWSDVDDTGPVPERGRAFDAGRPHHESRAPSHAHGPAVEADAPAGTPRRYAAFADLVDLAPAAAFIRDSDGRYLWANHAYAHLYGTVPEEVVGKCIEDFDAPADADQFRTLDQEILDRGTPVRHTIGYRRPDGSAGRAVGHRFPVREGARTCVAGIYVDVTDHLRATVQWQEAEENLQALRDHSGLPCALLSANGRVVEASAAAAELFGISLHELVGRRAHTLLAPEPGLDRLHHRWNTLIARRTRRVETSAVLVDAHGLHRRAQLHLTTIGHTTARARHVWAVVTHQSLAHEARPSLTAAQVRILSLLAEGSSNSGIATSLNLSRQTVDYHLSRLRHLLGAATRPALVARAYVLGILAPRAWPPRSATAAHPLSTV